MRMYLSLFINTYCVFLSLSFNEILSTESSRLEVSCDIIQSLSLSLHMIENLLFLIKRLVNIEIYTERKRYSVLCSLLPFRVYLVLRFARSVCVA